MCFASFSSLRRYRTIFRPITVIGSAVRVAASSFMSSFASLSEVLSTVIFISSFLVNAWLKPVINAGLMPSLPI